tara:strand:+ start:1070 stop:1852 length:783 start_codon:yes stop_codon:yes gene_type:complete
VTALATTQLAGRLSDYCAELFEMAIHLSDGEDPGDGNALRARLGAMFQEMTARAKQNGVAQGDATLAGYALVALLDEIILSSNWELKGEWMTRPLQMQYFNSFSAGEEFFTKLDELRADVANPAKVDVLEVYYLTLCMGFKGKHGTVQGIEVLSGLRKELAQLLATAPRPGRKPSGGAELSPRWRPPDGGGSVTKQVPVRLVAVICAALVLLVLGSLVGVVTTQADTVAEKLSGATTGEGAAAGEGAKSEEAKSAKGKDE